MPLLFWSMAPEDWHWACAEAMDLSVEIAADSFAVIRELIRFGTAMAAMIAITATTMISSIKVKPCSLVRFMDSFQVGSAGEGLLSGR